MGIIEGCRPHNGAGDNRTVLTVDHPLTKTALAGLVLSDHNLADVKRFSNALGRSVDRWNLRPRTGLFGRRLTKSDAARLLRMELAKLREVSR